ncbi:MAG TPA: MFS transporter [Pseudomonadales bacterium]
MTTRPASITLLALTGLYLAQGLPSGLLAHALPAIMSTEGVDVRWIGLAKLLALPWFFKALWAPVVDRCGNRRQWIVALQSSAAICLLLLSLMPLEFIGLSALMLMLGLLCLNTASATQDVATDGLAVSVLPTRWHGIANSVQVGAFKVGLIAGGSGLLLLLDAISWAVALQGMALLLLLLTVPVLLMPHVPRTIAVHAADARQGYWLDSFRDFFAHRAGMGAWLAVLLTFKVADSLGSAMIKPMLAAHGWDKTGMAELTLVASLCGLLGAAIGGVAYYRLGAIRSLLVFGFLQAVGIGAWALLDSGAGVSLVYGIAAFEQMADGMSTVALFAVMMGWCRSGHEGGDYTLQASLHMAIAGLGSVLSGFLAHAVGLSLHFLLAAGLGMSALWLVWRLRDVPLAAWQPANPKP